MTVSREEFQALLIDTNTVMVEDLNRFWQAHAGLDAPAFRSLMIEAYPEIVTPHISLAGDLTTDWYDGLNPASTFRAAPAALPPVEQLTSSAGWALSQKESLPLLAGSAQRMLYGGSRRTVSSNAEREGTGYARHASANACNFCRVLATRDGNLLYNTKKTAQFTEKGNRYHDNCHCIAVPVRSGGSYEPAPYVEEWTAEYEAGTLRL